MKINNVLMLLTLLSWNQETLLAATPSFQKDIRPIFEKRCSMCHNNEVWKERNWLDYDTAVKNKDRILNRVWIVKDMPPSGDLSMDERVLIKKWIDKDTPK